MTTLVPREPYSQEELSRLYPSNLKLQLVQILLRHGERTPISARFQNTGLAPYWPYCNAAKQMSTIVMTKTDMSSWDNCRWRRRLETFGNNDSSLLASGSEGEIDTVCELGELTDKGRETTLALGQRLRHLYVNQLGYMPKILGDADMIYIRATPMSRTIQSVQQSFWGLYPPSARTESFSLPTIITRIAADETLFPNETYCRRFGQLGRAFAQRAADRWNEAEEMNYLNSLISKWMPEGTKRVAVDSHPRLSGIMDTVNSTLAHGPRTRLPSEFYDAKSQDIIDKIIMEEWFAGYEESVEYRKIGIGSLVGDIVARMVGNVERRGKDGILKVEGKDETPGASRDGEKDIKFALSGCHDTTLAAILSSLGAFKAEKWPPYTSHLAIELFRDEKVGRTSPGAAGKLREPVARIANAQSTSPPNSFDKTFRRKSPASEGFARKPMEELSVAEKQQLEGHYVRLRYNDRPVVIPGCKLPGKHLEGDFSFCTLEAFKSIADKFTPKHWKEDCVSNLGTPAFPREIEPAGY